MVKRTRLTAFFAGTIYFLQGFLGISGIALPLYLRDLHWSISEITAVTSIAAIPWLFKILIALFSDAFPVFGFRRKSYLFFYGIISAIGWFMLAAMPAERNWILTAMLLSNLGFAATDVITDGFIVEHSAEASSSVYQAISWGFRGLGSVASGLISGWLAIHWNLRNVFLLTMCLPLIVSICASLLHEKKIEPAGEKPNLFTPLKHAFPLFSGINFRFFALVLFFISISASFGVPFFFYMKETLNFPETFMGFLSSLGWAGAVFGSFIYAKWLRKAPVHLTLRWAILINSLNIFSALLIHDQSTAFIVVFIGGAMGCLVMLPIVSSAATLTRQSGAESTLFAILMTVFNFGQILFGLAGSHLVNKIGLIPLISVAGTAALLGLIFSERIQFGAKE